MTGWHRVTIEEIIDLQGDHVVVKSVEYLERLRKTPHEEYRLRIELQKVRSLSDNQFLIICAWCHKPVMLRGDGFDRGTRSKKRLHFTHARPNANCPYQNKNVVSQKEINERKYHGLREGPRHLQMKERFAQCLMLQKSMEGNIEGVAIERVIRSDVRTWRKPDINFRYKGHRIAVEIQLSTTYLDVINDRHAFYRTEEICMLWLFDSLTLKDNDREFAKNDVIFNNNANAYVFDDEAYHRSVKSRVVTLKCYYVVYTYSSSNGRIEFYWKSVWITLGDLTFEQQNHGLYFFDSHQTLIAAQRDENRSRGFESLFKARRAFTEDLEGEYKWDRQEASVSIKNLHREIANLRSSAANLWGKYRDKRAAIRELEGMKDPLTEKTGRPLLRELLYVPAEEEKASKESLKLSETELKEVELNLEKILAYTNSVRGQDGLRWGDTPQLIDITARFPRNFYLKFADDLYGKARIGPVAVKYPNRKMLESDIADEGKNSSIYMDKTVLLQVLEQRILEYRLEIAQGKERVGQLITNHKELMIEKFRREREGIATDFREHRLELKKVVRRLNKTNNHLRFLDRQLDNISRNLYRWSRILDID